MPNLTPDMLPFFAEMLGSIVNIMWIWEGLDIAVNVVIFLISKWTMWPEPMPDMGFLIKVKNSVFRQQPTLFRKVTSLLFESM